MDWKLESHCGRWKMESHRHRCNIDKHVCNTGKDRGNSNKSLYRLGS